VNVADTLVDAGYMGKEVYVYAHSLGSPIALLFSALFAAVFKIKIVVALCPAGVYTESFLGLSLKIGRKILRDLRTQAGRRYWGNSPRYFANPVRSLREGRVISSYGSFVETGAIVQRHCAIPVIVGIAGDDDVFLYTKTLQLLQEGRISTFLLPVGSHHSPDYHPVPTVKALLDATSLLRP
jgi:pimeloyl-ACP methyl ester carboxylesterase